MTVSVIPTNRPCSTTPVTFLSSFPKPAGSLIPPSTVRSRIRFPLSVTYGVSSPPRNTRLTPDAAMRSAVERHRNGSTSTGSTPTPSCLTSFDSSTTTTKRLEDAATTFSRNRAPPRPLIRFRAGSTSSAPSTVRSICPISSVTIGIPSDAASSAVDRDDGTPRTFIPSATSRPRPSTKNAAVDPLPRPINMPSETSSSAFSAAARLYSSVNRFTDCVDAGPDAAAMAVHRVAGHEHRRTRSHYQRRGGSVDPSVDLDLHLRGQGSKPADLLRRTRYELLPAEPRLDRHHVDQLHVRQDLTQVFDRCRRVDGHAGLGTQLMDRLHRPIKGRCRLDLHLDQGGSRPGEGFEEQLRPLDHQVRLDRQRRGRPHRRHDPRAEGQVGHEMSVHDVDLDPVRSRLLRLAHLLRQAAEIGRKDRGDYLYPPLAARSMSHRAPVIIPDGVSPRRAAATAADLPAPVAMMSTRPASRMASNVIVTRCGGGLGESWMPAVSPVARSAGCPGKSELTCPSSPTPSSTKSNGATCATTSA